MRLKYYMRGMGVGIVVTTIIFLIVLSFQNPKSNTASDKADHTTIQDEIEQEQQETSKEDETANTDTPSTEQSNVETTVEEDGSVTTVETIEGGKTSESDVAAEDSKSQEKTDASEIATEPEHVVVKSNSDDTTSITVTISGGEGSNAVGSKLQQAGVVDSGSRFNHYLESNDYDNIIQPGTYSIPSGSTYEEIAQIITKRR